MFVQEYASLKIALNTRVFDKYSNSISSKNKGFDGKILFLPFDIFLHVESFPSRWWLWIARHPVVQADSYKYYDRIILLNSFEIRILWSRDTEIRLKYA